MEEASKIFYLGDSDGSYITSELAAAKLLEIYIWHDGPQFYSATVGQKIFVFLAVADELWACKELETVEDLIRFEQGHFDGKDLYLNTPGRLFLWRSAGHDSAVSVKEIRSADAIENKWHVPAGEFFIVREHR